MNQLCTKIMTSLIVACTYSIAGGQLPQTSPAAHVAGARAQSSANLLPTLQHHDPRYIIKNLDVLKLTFPLSPELDQTVTVQPDGYVNLKSAPSVHVEGLSAPEISAVVASAYSGILKDPIITVDIKDFQKPMFTVSGQVGKPGQYELRPEITVLEAIAVAGGLATTSTTHAYLFHRSEGGYKVEKIDLKPILNGKDLRENAMMQPGDMIVVPESNITKFRKYVPYSVGATYFPSGT